MEEKGTKWIKGKFECIHALEGTGIETESDQAVAAGLGCWASGGVCFYTPPSWMLAAFVHLYLK